MELEKKARLVFNFFGIEAQREKAKEKWLELQIALMELSKHRIKIKNDSWNCEFMSPEEHERDLTANCNQELADNIFLKMQFRKDTFEYCYELIVSNYIEKTLKHNYYLENFNFDKEEVRRMCYEKADRTIRRYNIKVEEQWIN